MTSPSQADSAFVFLDWHTFRNGGHDPFGIDPTVQHTLPPAAHFSGADYAWPLLRSFALGTTPSSVRLIQRRTPSVAWTLHSSSSRSSVSNTTPCKPFTGPLSFCPSALFYHWLNPAPQHLSSAAPHSTLLVLNPCLCSHTRWPIAIAQMFKRGSAAVVA